MQSANFERNPQFLWQHGASGALINTIGRVLQLRTIGDALYAEVEYDTSELAEQILQLSERGLMPANSIGFRPIEWHANDFGGNTFTKWELIECSKVELPMNPEAVDSRARSMETTIKDAAEWLCLQS
jgi:HK97 family phage prohead protease